MPFGSRMNNFTVTIATAFILVSVICGIVGQVISNRSVIAITHSNQGLIIRQNEQLLVDHHEMLMILHRIEARYLDGQAK